jgi:hypothetical protein
MTVHLACACAVPEAILDIGDERGPFGGPLEAQPPIGPGAFQGKSSLM